MDWCHTPDGRGLGNDQIGSCQGSRHQTNESRGKVGRGGDPAGPRLSMETSATHGGIAMPPADEKHRTIALQRTWVTRCCHA